MTARRRRHSASTFELPVLIDLGFMLALATVATFAAWPIYQTWYLLVTVIGALVIAGGVSLLGVLMHWSWISVALGALGSYLLFGVALAVPSAFVSRADFLRGFGDLVEASVFGWKKLVTVQTPVGHYQALLVPMLLVMLACGTAAITLTLRRVRGYAVAVPIMLVPIGFALAFGSSAVSDPLYVGGFPVRAPRELLVGILGLGLAGAFLVWHAQHARTVALRAVAAETGVRRPGGTAAGTVRRTAGAVAVALVALVVAVPLSSTAIEPRTREVLRTSIDPTSTLRQYVSPLTEYRAAFEPDDYDRTLLTVQGDASAVGRLRVATLSYYDGQQYTVLSSDSDRVSAFAHIPQLSGRAPANAATVRVTVDGYSGVWLPTVSGLTAVAFHGARTNSLTDGFYYNKELQAGAELDALQKGDSYTLAATVPKGKPRSLSSVTAPTGSAPDTTDIPKSLSDWVRIQGLGSDGAALAELIARLRERGYLSHSLELPTQSPNWFTQLGEPEFKPSLAGESMDRIDALFTSLVDQQNAASSGDSSQLVAGVGDDEQFAVASALIAESLGFPARVVLGFNLSSAVTDSSSIPACTDGVCTGKNLTAWVEVEDSDGDWIAANTTPQHTVDVAKTDTTAHIPRVPTQVQQRGARVQPPPEANPSGNDRQNDERNDNSHGGAADWLPALRIGGSILLILLVLAAPFAALMITKWARRRERRRAASAAERMAGGWDELVDTAVDLGLPAPGVRTRTEAATVYAAAVRSADAARMRTLASDADEAVFGAFDPTPQAAEQYWAQLEEQRSRLAAGFPRWKRLWALISLRSFRSGSGGRE